jgi:hypothetical protein
MRDDSLVPSDARPHPHLGIDGQDTMVIEWAPFRLADGAAEDALLEASETLQREFLRHQRGFLRRELLRGADGQWVDLVYWADQASADGIVEAVRTSPVCQAYLQLMIGTDPADPTAGVLHLHRVRSY